LEIPSAHNYATGILPVRRTEQYQNRTMTAPFAVHSIFRNGRTGHKVLPHGLEWDMGGDSLMAYVPLPFAGGGDKENAGTRGDASNLPTSNAAASYLWRDQPTPEDTPSVRRAIVEAHNRWCFAKDLPFRTVEDIAELKVATPEDVHYYVKWEDEGSVQMTESRLQDVKDVVRNDPSARGDTPPAEVWINGKYVGMLRPDTVPSILDKVTDTPSVRLSVKRAGDQGGPPPQRPAAGGGSTRKEDPSPILRIERRFRGMIRGQEVF
jgi:hypothetical protein